MIRIQGGLVHARSVRSALRAMALWTLLVSPVLYAQEEYQKNSYVRYESGFAARRLNIAYAFKDYRDRDVTFRVSFDSARLVEDGNRFGIPNWVWRPQTHDFRFYQTLKEGFHVLEGSIIRADKSAMVRAYAPTYGRPIASWIVEQLASRNEDSRVNRIQATMRFVQDIPYAVPPNSMNQRYFGGLIPVPFLLGGGWGDCDSKAVLFATIIVNLIPASQVAFINLDYPCHCFNGILDSRQPGRWTIPDGMETFVFAEATGPAHYEYGGNGFPYGSGYHVERLTGISELPSPLPFNGSGFTSNEDHSRRTSYWWLLHGNDKPDDELRRDQDDRERARREELELQNRRRQEEIERQEEQRRTEERRREEEMLRRKKQDDPYRWREREPWQQKSSSWSATSLFGLSVAAPIGTMEKLTDRISALHFILESTLFLGLRHESGLSFGAFANAGIPQQRTIASGEMHPVPLPRDLSSTSVHPFLELEGGLILFRAIRLSHGRGRQWYGTEDAITGETIDHFLDYNVSTAGLHIPLGSTSLTFSMHAIWITSLSTSRLRGSIGLAGQL